MKRKLFLLAGTLLLVASCLAQRTLALSDLSFRSDFEKNAFAKIDKNREKSTPADIIAVMMAGNVDTDDKSWQQAIQHLNAIIASLEEEKIGEKKAKKALKIIFERVHGHLRLYDIHAHFDQIFIDGTYNCLTASALNAYIHFFYTGISLALRRNYAESLVMLDSAYQLKPGNLALQNMIEEDLIQVLELPHPELTLKLSTDSLLTKYPFLSENDRFITYHCYQQLQALLTLIDNSNEKEAIAAVQVYQPKLDALKPSSEYNKSIEMIYASVYRIYVKHDDYRNGRIWLEKGLDLVPGSDLLQQKMDQLEEHVKKYGQDPYSKRKGNK